MLASLLSKIAPFKYYLLGAALAASFYGGWYVKGKFEDSKELKVKEAVIKQLALQDKSNRELVVEQQISLDRIRNSYILLGKELEIAKGKIGKCKADGSIVISNYGRMLWNDIGKGDLSEDSTRASEGTSGRDTTLEELYNNRLENAKQCNELREQIRKIIKWDKENFK